MKTKTNLFFIVVIFLLSSCAITTKFPVSSVVPSADISVSKKKDKNTNYVIKITAKNLAEPNRLTPPRNNYSVWIINEFGQPRNIGQILGTGSKKAVLKTIVPFNVSSIIITAEDRGDLAFPNGTEITRATIIK